MGLKDDIESGVKNILSESWNIIDGRVVPNTDDVKLAGGAVRLDATVLYADMVQSSYLATEFQQRTAAKVMKAFLKSMTRLITTYGGKVTSFDGDRVMGVFIGDSKNSSAGKCALKMNYAVKEIIKPLVTKHFESLKKDGFEISHCVGVDTSSILAVRAGQRGSNDLIWVGRAPNLAAKLSDIREGKYSSFITSDVYDRLHDDVKKTDGKDMWEKRTYEFLGDTISVYRSSWWWSF